MRRGRGASEDYARVLNFDPSLYDTPSVLVPLFSGSEVTLLQAVVTQFLWFSSNPGISKESLLHQFAFHRSPLPISNVQ